MMNTLLAKMHRYRICLIVSAITLAAGVAVFDVSLNADFEGLYLLKGENGRTLVLTNSFYLGEEDRLLAGFELPGSTLLEHRFRSEKTGLELEWNKREGRGLIRNRLADGTVLVTNFSRYLDSEGAHTRGLFVGGTEPENLHSRNLDGSGMTWFDGQQWNHIWCDTNEGIGSTVSAQSYAPSAWRYLGSKVNVETDERLVLSSYHEVTIDSVPLRITRTVEAVAGQPAIKLKMQIVNLGGQPGRYFYYYGDEPWLGEFGSSRGDVGWVDGRLVNYETAVDPKVVTTMGMIDYGNEAIGEPHTFRNVANFIGWSPATRPDIAFFANHYKGFDHQPEVQVPLMGNARSLGMYWGPEVLPPGGTQTIELDLGMAGVAEVKGLPVPVLHTAKLPPQTARRG